MSDTNSTSEISPSNSISLIKLDELSSFGATRQNRLPALIKLNTIDQNSSKVSPNSMPNFSESELEKQSSPIGEKPVDKPHSLPIELNKQQQQQASNMPETVQQQPTRQSDNEKENIVEKQVANVEEANEESDDFQVVDMQHEDISTDNILVGPSLPHNPNLATDNNKEVHHHQQMSKDQLDKSINALQSSLQLGNGTHLGDSLIEMVINLRGENQNLIRALETNNEYVKDRLSEFKQIQEDSKRREVQFAAQKADFEHQIRKLQRQNSVLSERLKSMEAKLKEMKLDVSESLEAAHSSKASSIRNDTDRADEDALYPLIDKDSFVNAALANAADVDPHQATTMQIDATRDELCNDEEEQQMGARSPVDMSKMSKEELEKHFDAKKVEFYALDNDPMRQCDKLEQQLNDIGKRDYEICLLQQQLNIYRQDFRLERMEKLEAKIQIERLKNDIDRLCLERLQSSGAAGSAAAHDETDQAAAAAASTGRRVSDGLGRLGHHLGKKAAKQAAKAAKYAAKQAHLEEKAAAAMARIAAARASHQSPAFQATTGAQQPQHTATTGPATSQPSAGISAANLHSEPQPNHSGHHRHQHHHRHHGSARGRGGGVRSEVVNDLLSTANKAMLTGYKMASTHVNLALDKLSQFEQQQANQLDKNKQSASKAPSAPVEYPSID